MRASEWTVALIMTAFCLTSCLFLRRPEKPSARPPLPASGSRQSGRHEGPFEQAVQEAWRWHAAALRKVTEEQEALEVWDPEAHRPLPADEWRQQMARDLDGDLQRSLAASERAARLARTPAQVYRATALRARLECDRGNHQAELEQARRLRALQPRNPLSLLWLRRAARCNQMKSLEQQMDRELSGAARTSGKS